MGKMGQPRQEKRIRALVDAWKATVVALLSSADDESSSEAPVAIVDGKTEIGNVAIGFAGRTKGFALASQAQGDFHLYPVYCLKALARPSG